jgi:hypothetical protein
MRGRYNYVFNYTGKVQMQMPFGLVIQDRKLTNYLLVYQDVDDKSEFLAMAGYRLQNWQRLKQDILRAVEGAEVEAEILTDWGVRFRVKSEWAGVNGCVLRAITIWQQDEGAEEIRLVTLYPDKSVGA